VKKRVYGIGQALWSQAGLSGTLSMRWRGGLSACADFYEFVYFQWIKRLWPCALVKGAGGSLYGITADGGSLGRSGSGSFTFHGTTMRGGAFQDPVGLISVLRDLFHCLSAPARLSNLHRCKHDPQTP
jgi:hypothetical protein